MKFIKKHFSVANKCSEIKKNGCDVLMIKGNTENGLTQGVTYRDEI